ncbi:hypothetical protein HN587_06700 [Candidatus Woesearchaeota archaeon]|mgnify:CR=1 FL=1|jgi:pheromone shutdown-related protein TraB|nr:hypothetical protein [Candidatus Woesearchaeota archaeon]
MKYKNLTLIGTSHVSAQSVAEIKHTIEKVKPEAVAVELDVNRLQALMTEQKSKLSIRDILQIGLKGYLFAKIGGWVQQKIGQIVRVKPGSDMRIAVITADKEKSKIYLIDQHIQITLKNLSKRLTWRERGRMVVDVFRAMIYREKELAKWGIKNWDLTTVPDKHVISKMINQVKKRYPNIYGVLIDDRNKIMAKRLVKIMKQHDGIVVGVVGAGHEEGMMKEMKRIWNSVEVVKTKNSKKTETTHKINISSK